MQDGTFPIPGFVYETACRQGDVYAADCPTRQLLDRVGDKWSVLILLLLGEESMRFNAMRRRIAGVSQKMLSQTLRSLERDGLVDRVVTPTMPVEVTYSITSMGSELIDALTMMMRWAEQRMPAVAQAQARFDARCDEPGAVRRP
ncbi:MULTISPECIES: winged helix-turn-helix transcriptional regulator [unclassified Sphingomonas]|uniref:winged helix-turn-helix transcriptional regulator n=1 Tax=unclassified Sphingomonas TaxID=196159 RepID=UPI0007016779|nr:MULTISPECIES: helix-turn-helix domain-containing protein [unclassified Sphingomonas]KQM60136.1 HxlR family transcriptional regulator [Sphingomonas sp. Leaf16]KQN11534.1 HxlR family transcriptional regulator [Sphingomonas sp. Leaf29]KQN18855.1 HxlR family transcriptional regulator [Sphingomonas sp. Leaf32]